MRPFVCFTIASILSTTAVRAAPPPELAAALQNLRDQRSYSWEIINGDPGPVAQRYETRRGTVSTVQQNTSPHVKGSLTSGGDALFQRDWPDGLQMDTWVTADGTTVTKTPEGWMNSQEILEAMADERLHNNRPTERYQWLRRADRPDLRRPDQELAPFIKGAGAFALVGTSYAARLRVHPDGSTKSDEEDDRQPWIEIALTLNVRSGVLRDYEVKIEGATNFARAGIQIPVNDDRIVVLTNLPVTRLEIPDEAREKLKAAKSRPAARE
jgi:hypothetical protein